MPSAVSHYFHLIYLIWRVQLAFGIFEIELTFDLIIMPRALSCSIGSSTLQALTLFSPFHSSADSAIQAIPLFRLLCSSGSSTLKPLQLFRLSNSSYPSCLHAPRLLMLLCSSGSSTLQALPLFRLFGSSGPSALQALQGCEGPEESKGVKGLKSRRA